MSVSTAWPSALEGTPAVATIERAIANKRLSHSLLLQGEDPEVLVAVAHAMADRILNVEGSTARFAAAQHPDCFHLRPAGKMRIISADATRELIAKVQVSANVSPNKVAIIQDADRMHITAANVFLKTLEEPPRNTTLLLLSSRPYALLPTIRSRVQYFRFPSASEALSAEGWNEWMMEFQTWLGKLSGGGLTKQSVSEHIFTLYGLIARFSLVLEACATATWEREKAALPADLEDDEKIAIEAGISNRVRARLFADIERATRAFAVPYLQEGNASVRRPFTATVEALEHTFALLNLNLNEATALEDFMLATLRLWSRK